MSNDVHICTFAQPPTVGATELATELATEGAAMARDRKGRK